MATISLFEGTEAYQSRDVAARETIPWGVLGDTITRSMWAPGSFRNKRRSKETFESIDLLVLDFDEELSLEAARETFKPYQCIVATTRNHQLPKGNKPPCDRFRVILQLERPITDEAEYLATWFSARALWPQLDESCKDTSRFFYPCVGAVEQWDGKMFPVADAIPKPVVPESRVPGSPKRRLKPGVRTINFILNGAPDGQWHAERTAATLDLKQQGWTQEEAIVKLSSASPVGELDDTDLKQIADIYANRDTHPPRNEAQEALKQLVFRCHQITDIADIGRITYADLNEGEVHDIDPELLPQLLYKDELKQYRETRAITARYTYDPRLLKPLSVDARTGVPTYNQYVPPLWLRDSFYHGRTLETETAMPEVYHRYLDHLVGGDSASKEYLLDWVAQSLRGRNFTMLTAIGEQGIGKGVMGELFEKLHGETNYTRTGDKVFKKDFNAELENRTLVYVDEADLRTKDAQDRMKDVVNGKIQIEKKGYDSRQHVNHASFYLTSNTMDAIKIENNDRRFSIIDLTDTPMKDVGLEVIIPDLLNEANVATLGRYLLGRKLTHNMLIPFKSRRAEEIKDAGLSEWECYVVEDLAEEFSGKTLGLKELKQAIKDGSGSKFAPGRSRIESLAKRYPNVLEYSHHKREVTFLGPKVRAPSSNLGKALKT